MTDEDATVLVHEQAAVQMAALWDRVLTEFDVSKVLKGDADAQALPGPEKGTTASERNHPLHGLYDLCGRLAAGSRWAKQQKDNLRPQNVSPTKRSCTVCLRAGTSCRRAMSAAGWNRTKSSVRAAAAT